MYHRDFRWFGVIALCLGCSSPGTPPTDADTMGDGTVEMDASDGSMRPETGAGSFDDRLVGTWGATETTSTGRQRTTRLVVTTASFDLTVDVLLNMDDGAIAGCTERSFTRGSAPTLEAIGMTIRVRLSGDSETRERRGCPMPSDNLAPSMVERSSVWDQLCEYTVTATMLTLSCGNGERFSLARMM